MLVRVERFIAGERVVEAASPLACCEILPCFKSSTIDDGSPSFFEDEQLGLYSVIGAFDFDKKAV